jgi:hypothetical protein
MAFLAGLLRQVQNMLMLAVCLRAAVAELQHCCMPMEIVWLMGVTAEAPISTLR